MLRGLCYFCILLSAIAQAAIYDGGDGTQENPYQIRTPAQLNSIGLNTYDWDNHFILTADIDMSAYTGTQYNIIGTDVGLRFSGTFDGNYYVIRNLSYTTNENVDYVGLFGCIYRATIKNVGLDNVLIQIGNQSRYTGGLAGGNDYSTVIGCYTSGSIIAGSLVGGLTGYNSGSGSKYFYQPGSVHSCYSSANVSGTFDVGGLVGSSHGAITVSYATGSVNGNSQVGGLTGSLLNPPASQIADGYIKICYAAGAVSGTSDIGGIAGAIYNNPQIEACFWDVETSGMTEGIGNNIDPNQLSGRTTLEMKTRSTFTSKEWNFSWIPGFPADWQINEGVDYPRLYWESDSPAPVASDITINQTNTNDITVELVATDDGLPGPLSFIITSLPPHGRLIDPNYGEILAVPYTLQNSDHEVLYQTCPYAQDNEQFNYKASDGGIAPNGGDSNEALVTITFNYDVSVYENGNYTLDYPFYTTWEDVRMQAIYLPQEFGAQKKISSLEFRFLGQAPAPMSNFTIRMQHTPMTQYPSEPNFINTGWTTVYHDNFTVSGTGWKRIDFQTPFKYDGENPVLVDISYNNTGHATVYGRIYAFNSPGRVIYQKARNNGDPLFWRRDTVGCIALANVPVLKLHGQAAEDVIVSDFNLDCRVGLDDLSEFVDVWMSQEGDGIYAAKYDITPIADQKVNLEDLATLSEQWLSGPFDGPFYLSGDFDLSGTVDILDLAILINAWLSQSGDENYDDACDISAAIDEKIDFEDWNVFSSQWIKSQQ